MVRSPRLPLARRLAGWLPQVLAWAVVFGALAVLALAVVIPRARGATPYAVNGGSMEPTLRRGDLVVVRPVAPDAVGVGAIVTYQLESGQPTVATHRVVATGVLDGRRVYRTQGDANDTADVDWVLPDQLRGELWYRVPLLGHAHSALTYAQRQLLVHAVAGALLAYATWMFAGALRDRGLPRPAPEGGP